MGNLQSDNNMRTYFIYYCIIYNTKLSYFQLALNSTKNLILYIYRYALSIVVYCVVYLIIFVYYSKCYNMLHEMVNIMILNVYFYLYIVHPFSISRYKINA